MSREQAHAGMALSSVGCTGPTLPYHNKDSAIREDALSGVGSVAGGRSRRYAKMLVKERTASRVPEAYREQSAIRISIILKRNDAIGAQSAYGPVCRNCRGRSHMVPVPKLERAKFPSRLRVTSVSRSFTVVCQKQNSDSEPQQQQSGWGKCLFKASVLRVRHLLLLLVFLPLSVSVTD